MLHHPGKLSSSISVLTVRLLFYLASRFRDATLRARIEARFVEGETFMGSIRERSDFLLLKIISSVQIYDKIMVQLKAKAGIDVTDLGILDFAIERLLSTLF